LKPAGALITSFGDLVANGAQFTFTAGIPGGTFTYQPNALTATDAGMALNIKGNVKDYDGFGLYLNSCADASAYTGVSFSVKGNVGPSAKLNFRVQLNSDTPVDTTNKKGTCVVPAGTTDTYPLCHSPSIDVTGISATAKTVTINFADLTGGIPTVKVDPKEIVGFEWALTWTPAPAGTGGTGSGGTPAGGTGTGGAAGGSGGSATGGTAAGGTAAGGSGSAAGPYDADVTIDDVMFVGGPAGGGTGSGGSASGGTASGGTAAGGGGAGGAASGGGGAGGRGGSGGTGGNP